MDTELISISRVTETSNVDKLHNPAFQVKSRFHEDALL
jgi:hypothetical protein